nr:hypothetical protein [Lactobacillus sp. W8093]
MKNEGKKMDKKWQKMYEAAKKVQEFTAIGPHMEAGGSYDRVRKYLYGSLC